MEKKIGRPRTRPSPLSEGALEAVCEALISGKSIRAICKPPHMPTYQSVYVEMARNEEFAKTIARARSAQQDVIADEMVEMADKATPENWNVVKLQIWARQWRAAKLAPKKYGDKVQTEHSGPDGGPMEVAAVTYTDADRANALAAFMAKTGRSFAISPPSQASDGEQSDSSAQGKKPR